MTAPSALQVLPVTLPNPLAAFAVLAGDRGAVLLDGGAAEGGRARWSILAYDPFSWIEVAGDGTVTRDGQVLAVDPFTALADAMRPFARPVPSGLPPFTGGAVGFMGYELGRHLERLPMPQVTGLDLPDMAFGLYDTVAVIDHADGLAWVISGGERADDVMARPASARERAQALHQRLCSAPRLSHDQGDSLLRRPGWTAELSPSLYRDRVARILDYIQAGDIYQANMTQRFLGRLRTGVTAWDLYRRLRPRTAAPFSAFLNLGGGRAIASGSPERFLSMTADGAIETRPIKGTRPRHPDPTRDRELSVQLLASEKDRAENLMIVDLLRNDLSRVAMIGSVKVPSLWGLESYRTVHHLTSVVTGQIKPGLGPVDLLRAAFPGGSITGAPKIRAMEVIREVEPARRGPYCGSVMWIGWDGAMDSSIIIRTAAVAGEQVQVQAGGGIVADSDPDDEYQESLTKAKAILTALDPAMAWPPAITADENGEQAA